METDYLSMCKNFYAATKIPVTLLKGKYAVYTSFNDILRRAISQPFPHAKKIRFFVK